ncbi:MAG: type II toxin-antitoxin system prevent-host-death family antitoxin [Propionibacteriaceae bacterium]|jgi:prevent-host-death family protein|nr:type II toxin-antitoxin system prevent-host-death family antitoxin [Propionibacteriaceae bacterium]
MTDVTTSGVGTGVGLKDLRVNLSAVISSIKAGHSYTLTEHGRPVARLLPVTARSNYERLVARGVITPARDSAVDLDPPVTASGTVSDLIDEQRR